MPRSSQGFTLIEFVIVVALISILAGLGVRQLDYYRETTHNSAATSDMKNGKLLLEAFYLEHGGYPH